MPIDPADIALCIADHTAEQAPGGAPMSAPIVLTSLFAFPTLDALQDGLAREDETHVYTRGQNPTVEAAERKIAALERGEACKLFASGMAAISAVMVGVLEAGDHVLFVNQTYGPTLQLADELRRFGVSHDVVLDLAPAAIERALTPATRLIWLESPGTMTFRVMDVPAVTALARSRGVLTCLDNSWATPLYQKPLELGVDIVVHTCSKYLNGHSDLMAGAVVTTKARMREIFHRSFMLLGGILSPHDAWLLLRGLRTLPARLARHEADALTIARALASHPAVDRVFHPALGADQALVHAQLRGCSGVFSFTLKQADFASVRAVIDGLQRFRIGVSWGGVESLVITPMQPVARPYLRGQQIPDGLIRLSIGLEGADALLDDLTQALGRVRAS
jgi:cystathionine beta-lyase/cystathionine gamma-synthase